MNLCFASVSKQEILRIQEDAVPGNTKKAIKFCLKVLKGQKRLSDNPTFEQFQDMSLAITDFINLSKPDCQLQVTLYLAIAEMNTAEFNDRSIKYYLTKHLSHTCCARKHSVFTEVLYAYMKISSRSFANCSFNSHFK